MSMQDGGQRGHQAGWAMARGEGAAADAAVARRGPLGPRRIMAGTIALAVLVVAVYWLFLRGGSTWAEATSVRVDVAGGQVEVAFTPPEGCWVVADDSAVTVLGDEVELALQLRPVEDGCASSHTFDLPPGAADLPGGAAVRQVACTIPDVGCRDDLTATVTPG